MGVRRRRARAGLVLASRRAAAFLRSRRRRPGGSAWWRRWRVATCCLSSTSPSKPGLSSILTTTKPKASWRPAPTGASWMARVTLKPHIVFCRRQAPAPRRRRRPAPPRPRGLLHRQFGQERSAGRGKRGRAGGGLAPLCPVQREKAAALGRRIGGGAKIQETAAQPLTLAFSLQAGRGDFHGAPGLFGPSPSSACGAAALRSAPSGDRAGPKRRLATVIVADWSRPLGRSNQQRSQLRHA